MVLQEQWERFASSSPQPKAEKGNPRVCLTYCCCGGCLWTWVGLLITWLQDTWKSWMVMELQAEGRLWNEGLSPSFSTPPSDTSLNSVQRGFLFTRDTEKFTFDRLPNIPLKSSMLLYVCTSGVLVLGCFCTPYLPFLALLSCFSHFQSETRNWPCSL